MAPTTLSLLSTLAQLLDAETDEITKIKNSDPPLRVDYILIAVNYYEVAAARRVFQLKRRTVERGLTYFWGTVQHEDKSLVTVVLLPLDDQQGPQTCAEKVRRAVEILSPSYLLLVGTAGGVSRKKARIKTGYIVVPAVIRGGTLKDTRLRDLPLQQPAADLYEAAWSIDQSNEWRKLLKDEILKELAANGRCKLDFSELVSTPNNLPDIKNQVLNRFVKDYPRMTAVEMEAAGLGIWLHSATKLTSPPRYLVIKGVSDLPYDEMRKRKFKSTSSKRKKANDKQRANWRFGVSCLSATFAKQLIRTYSHDEKPVPYKRLWCAKTTRTLQQFLGCSGVLYGVEAEQYSALAAEFLDGLNRRRHDNLHFFTVCAYPPKRLYSLVLQSFNAGRTEPVEPELVDLVNFARIQFPHFVEFSKYAEKYPGKCARVLLLDDFGTWCNKSNLNEKELKLFTDLNDHVECWGIDRRSTPAKFLTDYVILGEDVLLDYYDGAGVLNVGDVSSRFNEDYFLKLQKHFRRSKRGAPFRGLPDLIQEATEKFKSRAPCQAPEYTT